LRPNLVEKSSKAGGTPTQIIYGVHIGYSLPIWTSPLPDEELYFRMRIPFRWDGTTDPQLGVSVSLAANEDVGDNFKLQMEWNTTDRDTIDTSVSTTTSQQAVLTGRNGAYSNYFVFLNFDANDTKNPLIAGDMLSVRIRRIDADNPDITGEVIIWDWVSSWPVNKVYGDWEVETNDT